VVGERVVDGRASNVNAQSWRGKRGTRGMKKKALEGERRWWSFIKRSLTHSVRKKRELGGKLREEVPHTQTGQGGLTETEGEERERGTNSQCVKLSKNHMKHLRSKKNVKGFAHKQRRDAKKKREGGKTQY